MADNKIQGRAKKFDGTAIDYVSIFNWVDGTCIAQVTPDASGEWAYSYYQSLNVGITYIALGCEPITHGPYSFVSEWSPIPIYTGSITGVCYDPSDISTLFKDIYAAEPVTKDGDIVKLMLDKSGGGNHAAVGSYIDGTIASGLRYRKQGDTHWLEYFNEQSGLIANQTIKNAKFSVFAAIHNDISARDSRYLTQGLLDARVMFYATRPTGNTQSGMVIDGGVFIATPTASDDPHIYTALRSSNGGLVLQVDNLAKTQFTAPTTAAPYNLQLMRVSESLKGRFYGLVIFDDYAASTENIQNTKVYLANKAGIAI